MGYQWIIAQEGSRQSYAVPVAFQRINCLRLLLTDVWCRHGRKWLLNGPKAARAWAGRYNPGIPLEKVISFDHRSVVWLGLQHFRRASMPVEAQAQYYIRFGQWFAKNAARRLARIDLDPVTDCFFGFNTNCLETLEQLKARGVFTIVDQVDPGVVEERMVLEEAERWPGWEKLPSKLPQAYWDRLRAEWELSDCVLVNSEWSRDALMQQGVPPEKIIVIPLAIDLDHDRIIEPVDARGPLKVIWLGNVILRKGIQYLVEAAKELLREDIQFILAGPLGISVQAVKTFPPNIKILGRVTRDQLGKVYEQGHVFVLPTISDGFAITQLEAMAHGLPVIATPNCGARGDGRQRWVDRGPPQDGAALAAAILRLNRERESLREMSRQALETAKRYDLPSNALMIDREVGRLKRKRIAVSKTGAAARAAFRPKVVL